ncbi:MAG: preprotein translocase subunit SecA, partial [Bryobacterales bacterium]|nr:preprotein translocase subunit SecA [Bryobacterales bacterium]
MLAGLERIRAMFSGPAKTGLRDLLAAVRADRTSDGTNRELVLWFAYAVRTLEGTLGMAPFDVQIMGALAMAAGHIAEMQTGEGKTLTAVLTASWLAAQGTPVHVLTANDYLAQRDAHWMGPAYRAMGLSVAHLEQGLTAEERRQAYACDVVYATANEVGFDFLRDGLALSAEEQVQRGFGAVLVDECDSILIDEARIPLIIAGGTTPARDLTYRLAALARELRFWADYTVDGHGRNVSLTDAGAARVEAALGCGNLYDEHNLALYTAVIDALNVQALLRRDVDYLVRDGRIDIVDEHKGRVAQLRRWPAGLQTALEAKEGLELRKQAKILGSITTQSLIRQYEFVCGMT